MSNDARRASRLPRTWLLVPFALALAAAVSLRPVLAQDPAASPSPVAAGCAEVLGLAAGSACVRVVHASPDAGPVDVYLDGGAVLSGLAYAVASGYLAVAPGEHQLQVSAAGSPPDAAVIDTTLAVEAGIAYEVAAAGPAEGITALVNPVDLTPLPDGNARLRVVQAIMDAPPLDLAVAGGDVLVPALGPGTASAYLPVPVVLTPIELEVRAEGLPFPVPVLGPALEAGLVYSVYALGTVDDLTTLRVLPVLAPAQGATTEGPVASPVAIPLTVGTPVASPEAEGSPAA